MSNILNFKQPQNNNNKSTHPLWVRITIIGLVMLAMIVMPYFLDNRPAIYKEHELFPIKDTSKIPADYVVTDLSGNKIKLSQMLGDNITILAFWATWCGYCAKEFPLIDAIAPKLATAGIKFIPISRGDETADKITKFFSAGNIQNLQSVIATTNLLHKQLQVSGYPTFIALDQTGTPIAKLRPKWQDPSLFRLFEKLQAVSAP